MPTDVLLDTDILSAVIRRRPNALMHARPYLADNVRFTFSAITRFEILRGHRARNAAVQEARFLRLCATSRILPITDSVIDRAAAIYGDLYRRGELIGDADILIASTALEHGLTLVTNNTAHFARIPALQLENWLASIAR